MQNAPIEELLISTNETLRLFKMLNNNKEKDPFSYGIRPFQFNQNPTKAIAKLTSFHLRDSIFSQFKMQYIHIQQKTNSNYQTFTGVSCPLFQQFTSNIYLLF